LFHFSFFLSLFLRDVLLELRIVFLIFRLLDLFARGFFFNAKTGDKDTEGKYWEREFRLGILLQKKLIIETRQAKNNKCVLNSVGK